MRQDPDKLMSGAGAARMSQRHRDARPAPILFVHSGQDWIRGSEQCLLDLVKHLDRRRFAPVVCCDSPVLAEAARSLDVPVHHVQGWGVAATHWLPARREVEELRSLIRHRRIRLVHTNDTDPIKAVLPAARRSRVPVLAHLHITIGAEERRWSMLHQVALAVGVSRAAVEGLLDDGYPSSRTAVVYNGVDPDRLDRGDATQLRIDLGIPSTAVVLTVLGSLISRKGVDVALDAFEPLAHRRADCHLVFCGAGPDLEALRRRTQSGAIAGRVHFLGERPDAGAVLRDATDILVSAARQEAFPLNILEAAYFGIPIIASAIGPHREFLGDEGPGLLFPTDDAASLAAAMERLVGDAPLRSRLGQTGHQRVRESYLVSHVVQRFDALYSALLARPARDFGWIRGTCWPPSYTGWLRAAASRRLGRAGLGARGVPSS